MKQVPLPTGEGVLVSWIAVGAGPAPIVSALDVDSPLYRKIKWVYLCWRDAAGDNGRTVLQQTRDAIRRALDPFAPTVLDRPWRTGAAPTDHAAIRPFAERVLREVRAKHPEAHLYVHLSPGTPSMHAVWLVLGSTGFVEGPLTLLQGIPKDRRPNGPPIEAVPLEIDTWLRRFRSSRPRTTGGVDDGQIWDPADFQASSPMRGVLERLVELAPLPAPVMLLGERGSGKTTLANFLRNRGPFQARGAAAMWPSAVCGQFRGDPQMARSELFGHAKGAFTGAFRERAGLLEEADGDCLFLDEVADLDPGTQRLLIAAVEGRAFRRLGETTDRTTNFRLICATSRPRSALAGGALDHDFYDRIAVFTVNVPPLRALRPDLPMLWPRVLRRIAARAGVGLTRIADFEADSTLLDAFANHPLPGNFRDLERAAWHLVARLDAGPEAAAAGAVAALGKEPAVTTELPEVEALRLRLPLGQPLPDHFDALRSRYVEAALAASGGNKAEAARLLKVPRETFNGWVRG